MLSKPDLKQMTHCIIREKLSKYEQDKDWETHIIKIITIEENA